MYLLLLTIISDFYLSTFKKKKLNDQNKVTSKRNTNH